MLSVAVILATADRLLEELFGIAHTSRNDALKLQAHHAAWPTLMVTGSFAEARRHIAAGLELYRREAHGDQAFQYGSHDPGVCAYCCDALIGTVVGLPDHSAGQIRQALALANELEHGPTLVHALGCAAELHYLRREPQKTEHYVVPELAALTAHAGSSDVVAVHFIGSIVYVEQGLSQVSHQAPLLVIDGQQRLTTVSLLIEALALPGATT